MLLRFELQMIICMSLHAGHPQCGDLGRSKQTASPSIANWCLPMHSKLLTMALQQSIPLNSGSSHSYGAVAHTRSTLRRVFVFPQHFR